MTYNCLHLTSNNYHVTCICECLVSYPWTWQVFQYIIYLVCLSFCLSICLTILVSSSHSFRCCFGPVSCANVVSGGWAVRELGFQSEDCRFDFQPCQMTLCPCARHFTLLASGNVPVYCKLLWKGTKCKCASWLEEVDGEDVTLQHLSPHLAGTVCWPDGLKNFLCHAHLAQLSCSHPT